jgi:hypothetical protein
MSKKYGGFTEEIKKAAKDILYDTTHTALKEYDPETDCAESFIAAIGSMHMIVDMICLELDKEDEEEKSNG